MSVANVPSRLALAALNDPTPGVGQTNLNPLHALLAGGSFLLHGGGQRQDNQVLALASKLHQHGGLSPALSWDIAHQIIWNPYRGPEGAVAEPIQQAFAQRLAGG